MLGQNSVTRSGCDEPTACDFEGKSSALMEMTPYKMSFSTGGLFINESVHLARLHEVGEDWSQTISRGLSEGTAALPKTASNRRTLREIANRISCLNAEELGFLVGQADRPEQEALLWVATCRAYRFIREFVVEVIQERFLSYRLDLPLDAFDHFFDSKAEWSDELASISRSTRLKLRQVLFRMLREAGVIDTADKIRPAYVTPRLRALIESQNPADIQVFPGLRP